MWSLVDRTRTRRRTRLLSNYELDVNATWDIRADRYLLLCCVNYGYGIQAIVEESENTLYNELILRPNHKVQQQVQIITLNIIVALIY